MDFSAHLTRRHMLKALLGVAVGATTGAAGWGFFYERTAVRVTRADIPVSGLPDAMRGLRIALLTDTHRSETVGAELINRAVHLAGAASPDLVILGGDYVTWLDRRYAVPAAEALAGLRAPLGVFAVLGNHDDEREVPAALRRQGYEVLRDDRTTLTARGERLDLVGVRFWTRRAADIGRILRGSGGVRVLLAHDPRRLAEAVQFDVPLVLSGHTHGGQIVLPGIGALARKFPVLSGLARSGRTTLFVSRGIGTVYVPIRINCPPEVAILTLTSSPEPRASSLEPAMICTHA